MASREKEISKKVIALVSDGDTEGAISYLEETLKAIPNHDPQLFHDVILLSNMYSNYERKKLRGTIADDKDLNNITSEVLDLTKRIERNGVTPSTRSAAAPLMNQSPDPLQPVYQRQPVSHPVAAAEKKQSTSRVVTILAGIGAVFVFLIVIGFFMDDETYVDDLPQEPYSGQEAQQDPNQFVAPPPPATSSASEIRAKMQQLFNSGVELDENDLVAIDPSFVRSQLANTTWYEENMSYLSFDGTGFTGTYLNGTGQLQVALATKYGFWFCTYVETSTGDSGYMGIVPPGSDPQMTIYVESEVTPGASRFAELQRR